jgi:hypothetical protein
MMYFVEGEDKKKKNIAQYRLLGQFEGSPFRTFPNYK